MVVEMFLRDRVFVESYNWDFRRESKQCLHNKSVQYQRVDDGERWFSDSQEIAVDVDLQETLKKKKA